MHRFLVDDIPIRRYLRKSDTTFPLRPMWVYGSIWDASSWATEDGKYKADYRYQPFIGQYTNFKASGCSAYASLKCRPVSVSPYRSGGLTRRQFSVMRWIQRHYMIYNYCIDHKRDHSLTPECHLRGWYILYFFASYNNQFLIKFIMSDEFCIQFYWSFISSVTCTKL